MALTDRIEKKVKFGHLRDKPDPRDILLHPKFMKVMRAIPETYDQSGIWIPGENQWTPAYDQGDEGSCDANSGGAVAEHAMLLAGYPWKFRPSRSFLYWFIRVTEGSDTSQDTGGTIRGAWKAMAKYGLCPEGVVTGPSGSDTPAWAMPYVAGNFAQAPSEASIADGPQHCAIEYQSVPQDIQAVMSLISQNIPVHFGFQVYSSFMTQEVQQTGIMPVPSWLDSYEGGHAVVALGFLNNYPAGNQGVKNWVIVRNSWGTTWGKQGTFLMPQSVFLNASMSSDFWAGTKFGFQKTPQGYTPTVELSSEFLLTLPQSTLDWLHVKGHLPCPPTDIQKNGITAQEIQEIAKAVCAIMGPACAIINSKK